MKRKFTLSALLAALTFLTFSPLEEAKSQDFTSVFLNGLAASGGYLIGREFEDQWEYAPILGAAAATALVDFGYQVFRKKDNQVKVDYYISGRNYERWLQSNKIWYQSTLDPYTGRPPAFSGLTAMDDGIPKPPPGSADEQGIDITQTFSIPVKMPAGTYNGTPRTERIVPFPKLP